MLAHMTRAEVKRILREHGMQAYTTNTYRSYEELEPELRRIREAGVRRGQQRVPRGPVLRRRAHL